MNIRSLVMASAVVFLGHMGPAHAGPGDYAIPAMPFTGYWDRFSVAHPSYHHTPWGSDWAIDLYASSGTWVSHQDVRGNYAYVNEVGSACSGAGSSLGGSYVKVINVAPDGAWLGWNIYAHLANVQVAAGSWIGSGWSLGTTRQWAYSNCYQVSNDAGTHVHYEAYNYNGYACYIPYNSGSYFGAGSELGRIGLQGTAGVKRPCW